jgi:hypothetical protein
MSMSVRDPDGSSSVVDSHVSERHNGAASKS